MKTGVAQLLWVLGCIPCMSHFFTLQHLFTCCPTFMQCTIPLCLVSCLCKILVWVIHGRTLVRRLTWYNYRGSWDELFMLYHTLHFITLYTLSHLLHIVPSLQTLPHTCTHSPPLDTVSTPLHIVHPFTHCPPLYKLSTPLQIVHPFTNCPPLYTLSHPLTHCPTP